MLKQVIKSEKYPNIQLRSIEERDLENLRVWKNRNSESFFHKEYITASMQINWYEKYLFENTGCMYLVEEHVDHDEDHPIGCMGYRVLNGDGVDLYNIIRGADSHNGQTMASAMRILIGFLSNKWWNCITCKVLKSNPAINWYIHAGFHIVEDYEDYVIMTPNDDLFIDKISVNVTQE